MWKIIKSYFSGAVSSRIQNVVKGFRVGARNNLLLGWGYFGEEFEEDLFDKETKKQKEKLKSTNKEVSFHLLTHQHSGSEIKGKLLHNRISRAATKGKISFLSDIKGKLTHTHSAVNSISSMCM